MLLSSCKSFGVTAGHPRSARWWEPTNQCLCSCFRNAGLHRGHQWLSRGSWAASVSLSLPCLCPPSFAPSLALQGAFAGSENAANVSWKLCPGPEIGARKGLEMATPPCCWLRLLEVHRQNDSLAGCVSRLFKRLVTCAVDNQVFQHCTVNETLGWPHFGMALEIWDMVGWTLVYIVQCGHWSPGFRPGLRNS